MKPRTSLSPSNKVHVTRKTMVIVLVVLFLAMFILDVVSLAQAAPSSLP